MHLVFVFFPIALIPLQFFERGRKFESCDQFASVWRTSVRFCAFKRAEINSTSGLVPQENYRVYRIHRLFMVSQRCTKRAIRYMLVLLYVCVCHGRHIQRGFSEDKCSILVYSGFLSFNVQV